MRAAKPLMAWKHDLVLVSPVRNRQALASFKTTAFQHINRIFHACAKTVLAQALPFIEFAIDVHGERDD